MVAVDPGNWLLSGVVTQGQVLPRLIGNEYERVDLRVPTPRPIEVLFHSPVTCGGTHDFADASYYTTPEWRGGVLRRDPVLDRRRWTPATAAGNSAVIGAITTRLLTAFAQGPAGADAPGGGQPGPARHPPPGHWAGSPAGRYRRRGWLPWTVRWRPSCPEPPRSGD